MSNTETLWREKPNYVQKGNTEMSAVVNTTAEPVGPVAGTKLTDEYVRLVARDAFFWA